MKILKIKTFEDIVGLLCEVDPDSGVRYCTLRTKDGKEYWPDDVKELEHINTVGIVDTEIDKLWKHYWVRPKTFSVTFKRPTTCHVGTSKASGVKILVCGPNSRRFLLEE